MVLGFGIWQVIAVNPIVSRWVAFGIVGIAIVSTLWTIGGGFARSLNRLASEMPLGTIETLSFDSDGYSTMWSDGDRSTYVFYGDLDQLFAITGVVVVSRRHNGGYLLYPHEVFPLKRQQQARQGRAASGLS